MWICANCGAPHDENDPPCRECAHEQFAELDESQSPSRPERSGFDIAYRCRECGRDHYRNNPPCNACGSMQFETVRGVYPRTGVEEEITPNETQRGPGNAPIGEYFGPTQRYYWLAFVSIFVLLSGYLVQFVLSVLGYSSVAALGGTVFGYAGGAVGMMYDDRTLKRTHSWNPGKPLIGTFILLPFASPAVGVYYLYHRHRATVSVESGRLSYSAYLVWGFTSAALALVLFPPLFGLLAAIAGYRIRSAWDQFQGTVLIGTAVVTTVIGWLLGITAV